VEPGDCYLQAFDTALGVKDVNDQWSEYQHGWERSARFKIDAARLGAGHLPATFAEDGPARHEIVLAAIARAKTYYRENAFQRVVLVGDAIWDLRCAQKLGVPFVAVAHPDRATHFAELGTSHVIEHYIDQNGCFRCLEEARVPGTAR
jgi:hypothetical protein